MLLIKSIFQLLYFLFIIYLSCKSNNNYLPSSLKYKKEGFYIEAKIDSIKIEDGRKYILVTTKLVNHTPNTIRYINYSCSWDDAYLTDNKNLDVDGHMCNKNVPNDYTIYSGSSEKDRVIKVLPNPKINISGTKFRIGFIYIPFRSAETFDEDVEKLYIVDSITYEDKNMPCKHIRRNDKANIFWSDTLTVK